MRLHVLTLDPPTVIPGEHHLTRDEGLVPLTGLGEHYSALLLSDAALFSCGTVVLYTFSVVVLLAVSVAVERDTAQDITATYVHRQCLVAV